MGGLSPRFADAFVKVPRPTTALLAPIEALALKFVKILWPPIVLVLVCTIVADGNQKCVAGVSVGRKDGGDFESNTLFRELSASSLPVFVGGMLRGLIHALSSWPFVV